MTIPDRRVVPFRHWHYDWLSSGEPAEGLAMSLPYATLLDLERQNSWTGVVDGLPMICAGTIPQWPGRYVAWAYVRRGTLPHLAWMTEAVRTNLAGVRGRIEFTVRADFKPGHRWARALGFEMETPCLRAYGPEGESHVGYVRIN